MSIKSPFFVVEEFISPLQCEDIIERQRNNFPDEDHNGVPLKTVRENELTQLRLLPLIDALMPDLEAYYGFERKGILPLLFEWYVEGFNVEPAKTKSFAYHKNKWVRMLDVGFTGIIFLNDYNNTAPFDPDFEVCGGKLEFPTHRFSFNPQRGTLVFFPEAPNFVHTTSAIQVGELNQIRFHVVPEVIYNYDMSKFPGNYKSWFNIP